MSIEFKKAVITSSILNPAKCFQQEEQTIEQRWDPLTGWKRLFTSSIAEKGRAVFPAVDEQLMEEVISSSERNCIFCSQNLERMTPKFPPELIPEGRIHSGEAWVIPNLYSVYDVSALTVLSGEHFLRMGQLSPQTFTNALNASCDFIRRVYRARPECRYAVMGMNYLPPAGSSIIHPHFQLCLSQFPFSYLNHMLERSEDYYQRNSASYWGELATTEKEIGERYIGETGSARWLAAFSPMGFNEVQAIICRRSNFLELDSHDTSSISEGLSRVLNFYREEFSLTSFNAVLLSGPLGEERRDFSVNLKIISRPNLRDNCVCDTWFGQQLLLEAWNPLFPESLAASLRDYFQRSSRNRSLDLSESGQT